ncbi:MAG: TadA family conjugal transfer-associated ATPase [Micromonosporaceae bacterium]|nr:TadA family conjugal transfer-associated ATPase [Micromonosporaceae bacterium]
MSGSQDLLARVRGRLALAGEAPTPASIAAAIRAERGSAVGEAALRGHVARLRSELIGAGPLEPLLADPSVTDVLVNGAAGVWVDRGKGLQRARLRLDAAAVRALAQRLATACGRRLDDAQPYVDARLPDGTRLHAVLPPIAVDGPCLSLRTFRRRGFSLDELVSVGTVSEEIAPVLAAVVVARLPYLVTGGTGSGKTTLLNTLLGLTPQSERIVVVEDAAELRPAHPHMVGLAARAANAEGAGEVTMRELVRQALRMRPDRIIVGECRGGEIVELLAALNTGHDGGAGTLHANSPADVPARLEALGLLGGLGRDALHAQVASALRVVLHLDRASEGRRLREIDLLSPGSGSRVRAELAWRVTGGLGPAAGELARMLAERGAAIPQLLTEGRPPAGSSPRDGAT